MASKTYHLPLYLQTMICLCSQYMYFWRYQVFIKKLTIVKINISAGFPTSYMYIMYVIVYFSCFQWLEVIVVHFVGIGGITEHHWLNSLFISTTKDTTKELEIKYSE